MLCNAILCLAEDITFDDAPNPQNPAIHQDWVIKCRVSAEPTPEVSWRYNGEKIEESTLSFASIDYVGYSRSNICDTYRAVTEDCCSILVAVSSPSTLYQ